MSEDKQNTCLKALLLVLTGLSDIFANGTEKNAKNRSPSMSVTAKWL